MAQRLWGRNSRLLARMVFLLWRRWCMELTQLKGTSSVALGCCMQLQRRSLKSKVLLHWARIAALGRSLERVAPVSGSSLAASVKSLQPAQVSCMAPARNIVRSVVAPLVSATIATPVMPLAQVTQVAPVAPVAQVAPVQATVVAALPSAQRMQQPPMLMLQSACSTRAASSSRSPRIVHAPPCMEALHVATTALSHAPPHMVCSSERNLSVSVPFVQSLEQISLPSQRASSANEPCISTREPVVESVGSSTKSVTTHQRAVRDATARSVTPSPPCKEQSPWTAQRAARSSLDVEPTAGTRARSSGASTTSSHGIPFNR